MELGEEFKFPFDTRTSSKPLKPIMCKLGGPNGDCWECTSHSRTQTGYPMLRLGGKSRKGSRTAYMMVHGEIPEGLVVMHICDNRACINPDHLQLGTQRENMDDCGRKDRFAKGKENGKSVLTEAQVVEIKKTLAEGKEMMTEIAKKYGVHVNAIHNIKYGVAWKWVEVTA